MPYSFNLLPIKGVFFNHVPIKKKMFGPHAFNNIIAICFVLFSLFSMEVICGFSLLLLLLLLYLCNEWPMESHFIRRLLLKFMHFV